MQLVTVTLMELWMATAACVQDLEVGVVLASQGSQVSSATCASMASLASHPLAAKVRTGLNG